MTISLPENLSLDHLRLVAQGEVFVESLRAEVSSQRRSQGHQQWTPQVSPDQIVSVQVNQQVRGGTRIDLKRLLETQQNLSLVGAEIERVIVEGQSVGGRTATVQLELNQFLLGSSEFLSPQHSRKPLRVQSMELVSTNLSLHVRGDAFIQEVLIRIGRVEQRHEYPRENEGRIFIGETVESQRPLMLARYTRGQDSWVQTIELEAQALESQAELAVVSVRGEFLGSSIVRTGRQSIRINLSRPTRMSELLLQSWSRVRVDYLTKEESEYSFEWR
jgi:hypothetical protein